MMTLENLQNQQRKKKMRKINEIIVHCTATKEGKDYTVADIDKWHKARGWKGIGYHYVVYRDGTVHTGRPVNEVGAHCLGHNTNSIGVVYVGGVADDGKTPKDTRTAAQRQALKELLIKLSKQYRLPKGAIHGHRDFAPKTCPSYDATTEYKNIGV